MNIDFSKGITKTVEEISSVKVNNNDIIKFTSNKYLGMFRVFSVLFENRKEIYLKLYLIKKQIFCIAIKF